MTDDYLGCDPGLNGGFAVVSSNRINYKLAMPTFSFTTKEGKIKTEIDREGMLSFLKNLPEHTHVAIEKAEAFRNQNITSTCTICKNYGILLMALTVSHMYITEVPSDLWQAYFGIVSVKKSGGESTKEQAFHIAQGLYPDTNFRRSERSHIVHDGIVDATLLARYCQSLFEPSKDSPTEVRLITDVDEIPLTREKRSEPRGKDCRTKAERRLF